MSIPARSKEPPGWEFQSRVGRLSGEDLDRFARRLATALRAGSGIGAQFQLMWTTGVHARITLRPQGVKTREWLETVLFPAFGSGAWCRVPMETVERPSGSTRFLVRTSLPYPAQREGFPTGSVADSLLKAFQLEPSGIHVEMNFAPAPRPEATLLRWLWGEDCRNYLPTAGLGPRGSSTPDSSSRGLPPPDRPGWVARARMCGPIALPSRALRGVENAVLRCVGPLLGSIRFVSRIRGFRMSAPLMLVSEYELESLLPTPDTVIESHRDPLPDGFPLSIGFSVQGSPLSMSVPPHEGRHAVVVGETGVGKSSLLIALAEEACVLGNVLLIDPIGDTAHRFLARLSPSLQHRTTWISPVHSPIAINALNPWKDPIENARHRERTIPELVAALRRVRASRYGDSPFWGPRIEEVATSALWAASQLNEGTLVDAQRLLEGEFDGNGSATIEVRGTARELARRARERPEEVDGARRLISEINRIEPLRVLLAERKPTWSLEQALARGRNVVISGDATHVGETAARYLSSIYLALLWATLLGNGTEGKRFLVLDEVQWFAQESLAEALRVGRRLNLHVWMATQSLTSLGDPTQEAAMTNASEYFVFRGSPQDAREIARWTGRITPETLLGLPRGEAMWLQEKGRRIELVKVNGSGPPRGVGSASGACAPAGRSTPYDDVASPTPTVESPALVTASDSRTPENRRKLLLLLCGGLPDGSTKTRVTIHLAPLRAFLDPSGLMVREVGTQLSRNGALVETGRDASGTYWVVDPRMILPALDSRPESAEIAETRALWKQFCRKNLGGSPQQSF